MKLIFVYRNGKTFTASNVESVNVVTDSGNVTAIDYTRYVPFSKLQETGEFTNRDIENGIFTRRRGFAYLELACDDVRVKVNKSQLSYVIVEEMLGNGEYTDIFSDTPRNQLTIIPALDNFTPDNIRDVIKTIS